MSLDDKILEDFHGNPLIFDEELKGKLPTVDMKAQISIDNILQAEEQPSQIRFSVVGGGCHGLQYAFDLEEMSKKQDDVLICDNPRVVVDSVSLKYLPGAVIKWVTDVYGSRFEVENPGATQSCGCGTSFNYDFEDFDELFDNT